MSSEQILLDRRYNYLPWRFVWRGAAHYVCKIERAWSAHGWLRRPRHYFRVRCLDDQVYDIFQDVGLNAWFVKR